MHPGPPRCVCQHDNRHQTPPTPPPPGAATDCREARRYILVIACPFPRVQPLTLHPLPPAPCFTPIAPPWARDAVTLAPVIASLLSSSFRSSAKWLVSEHQKSRVSRFLFLAFALKSISRIDRVRAPPLRLSFRSYRGRGWQRSSLMDSGYKFFFLFSSFSTIVNAATLQNARLFILDKILFLLF